MTGSKKILRPPAATTGLAAREHPARLVILALEERQAALGMTSSELAAALDIHPSHWYRLKDRPAQLAHCSRKTLESIAERLDWPLGRTLIACGVYRAEDFDLVLNARATVEKALASLERSPFAATLRTPLAHAAQDHQRLLAELYHELSSRLANEAS